MRSKPFVTKKSSNKGASPELSRFTENAITLSRTGATLLKKDGTSGVGAHREVAEFSEDASKLILGHYGLAAASTRSFWSGPRKAISKPIRFAARVSAQSAGSSSSTRVCAKS